MAFLLFFLDRNADIEEAINDVVHSWITLSLFDEDGTLRKEYDLHVINKLFAQIATTGI